MKKDETKNTGQQHEDAVLKLSAQAFATELLPYFNIEGKVVAIAPTELVQLEIHKMYQDYNFVMEDGTWKHFEFQSTNEGIEGLKRFRNYEAMTSYQHKVPVTTYVLYSGKIKEPVTEFTEGINTYRVQPIIMQGKNADELILKLENKVIAGEKITKEDIVPLSLTPLMGGESSIKDRLVRSYQILQASCGVATEDIRKIEAVIYAMADKFLEEMDIEEIQEMMAMTRIGQALFKKGEEQGKLEGKLEGMAEKLVDQISKKLAKEKTIAEIAEALEETEEVIEELIGRYNLTVK